MARLERELGPVARFGRRHPVAHPIELLGVGGGSEEGGTCTREELEPVQALAAEVVLPALQDSAADFAAERRGGSRYVLGEELLLQGLGRGGDDDALAREECRDQVGETLADAGPGLCEQVLLRSERMVDRLGERSLLVPRLEPGQGGGERTGMTEEGTHGLVTLRGSPVIIRTCVPSCLDGFSGRVSSALR